MAVPWISSGHKTELKTPSFPHKERFYIDPRQLQYPPINDDTAFTLITSGDNQPGRFNLTSGHCDYLLPLDGITQLTVIIRVLPQFAYDTGDDQPVWSWYVDANTYLTLFYDAGTDQYHVKYKDGGTERTMESTTTYTSDGQLQVWTDLAVSINFGTSEVLYIDRSSEDTSWSGAEDSKTSYFPFFSLRHENATEGNYYINYLRICTNDAATSTEISTDLSTIKTEEIFWSFDGHGLGRTRCNVSSFVRSFALEKTRVEPTTGLPNANSLTLELHSASGEFADDQYDTWNPPTVYNGTSAQKYLQKKFPISMEHWYSNIFEPIFIGRAEEVNRLTDLEDLSVVSISAKDMTADVARARKAKATYYDDKKLSDATETDSLVHLIARLATQREVINYASNSSFENATITNSWSLVDSGAGATWARGAGGLFGSFQGELAYGNAICYATQIVTFTGTKKLNVGETWNFSIWLSSTTNITAASYIQIIEQDAGGNNDNTTQTLSITANKGWKLFEVSHTITDSDSDRLQIVVALDDNATLLTDGAMLVQNDRAYKWWVLNNNDGSGGTESADDADSDAFDQCGFDVDAVNIVHPWCPIEQQTEIWDYLREIAVGTVSSHMGFDSAGVLKFRSRFKTGYSDPTPIETISECVNILSYLAPVVANKIEVHGVKITENTNYELLWYNRNTAAWDQNLYYIVLADGDDYPDNATFGDFWAQYTEYSAEQTEALSKWRAS